MYVKKSHKFLYLAHPKTGSTATAQALNEQLGFPNTHDHHGRLEQAEDVYGIDTSDGWIIATTVRNHFDAAVSWFAPHVEKEGPNYLTADYLRDKMRDSLYWFPEDGAYYSAWHLEDANFVIEYENLNTELNYALKLAGLSPVDIPRVNPTRERQSRDHYTDWYKESGIRYIRETYAQELNRLLYTRTKKPTP